MSFPEINFWIEGDISTTRVVSRLLDDVAGGKGCFTKMLYSLNWASLEKRLNIFCRTCHPRFRWLPRYLKERGIPYVYYLDDNFWRISGTSDLARYYQSEEVVASLDAFVRGAECVITHNRAMFTFITARFPGIHCVIVPPPFDLSVLGELPPSPNDTEKNTVVGYAGGYKADEFTFLESVISRLRTERPDIRFEFIGGASDRLRSFNSVQWFPGFSDYAEFIKFKASRGWKIGLAPLLASEFNASKTDNKFREYGGCHIAGIYSRTSPYIESVRNEETGLLVKNNVEDWVSSIKRLADDHRMRQNITSAAFEYVDSKYSHSAIVPAWRAALAPAVKPVERSIFSLGRFVHLKFMILLQLGATQKESYKIENASFIGFCTQIYKSGRVWLSRKKRKIAIIGFILVTALVIFTLINANYYFFEVRRNL